MDQTRRRRLAQLLTLTVLVIRSATVVSQSDGLTQVAVKPTTLCANAIFLCPVRCGLSDTSPSRAGVV